MLGDNDNSTTTPASDAPESPPAEAPPAKKTARKTTRKAPARTAKKVSAAADEQPTLPDTPPDPSAPPADEDQAAPARKTTAKKAAAKKTTAKKAAAKKTTAKKTAARKTTAPATLPETLAAEPDEAPEAPETPEAPEAPDAPATQETAEATAAAAGATALLFKAPDPVAAARRTRKRAQPAPAGAATDDEAPADGEAAPARKPTSRRRAAAAPEETAEGTSDTSPDTGRDTGQDAGEGTERTADEAPGARDSGGRDSGDFDEDSDEAGGTRRRRRRGGRRRRKSGGGDDSSDSDESADSDDSSGDSSASGDSSGDRADGGRTKGSGQRGSGQNGERQNNRSSGEGRSDEDGEGGGTRRRRRRRRAGEEGDGGPDDPEKTVTRVRKARNAEDEITSVTGSTRLEAKKQRRREGREAGRRRAPIVSEAEFLARREAVDRVMVIRQRRDLTQIAVLEDKVLVEHYVARESQTSLIGNVYLGRVQNVLPSMEAAFVDIGKGRNAVLYAGEVNWDSLGAGNGPRKIEQVLKSGQPILVQVTKDPIGHKGARLTSQVSLPGRFLVYVPDGTTSGISRKLPDTERTRLKTLLKEIVPDTAGVIVRTAAEGASEDELTRDVERLTARWSEIEAQIEKGNAPQLLYGEPDLTLKVVRDLFTEDFAKLVVSGDEAWDMVDGYVENVAPDLAERLERYSGDDVFGDYRIDEQIAKGLDRKVWLPSGGSLIIDRTEAMTVVDVNTGKFTGSGGNLEETVTKNNLEAAEEMVRQLRLRDIGGIIVVDFIDMVLESNRDLVLRRLVECLGRDRTRHQVAEVTSLGLVQMTRKRIGTGLLEAFSETCDHCQGRGLLVHHEPVEQSRKQDEEPRRGRRGRNRGPSGDEDGANANGSSAPTPKASPSPKDIAAMARHEKKPVDVAEAPPEAPPEPAPAAERSDETALPATPPEAPGRDAAAAAEPERQAEPPAPEAEPESAPETPAASTPQAPVEPPVVPAGPRLVTSSRRRVARRPAGPPSGAAVADGGSVATSERSSGGSPAADESESPEGVHVPVKKKGSRKR